MTGDTGTERIVPFRGDYYTLTPDAGALVRGLTLAIARVLADESQSRLDG